jgi:ribosomal protein L31
MKDAIHPTMHQTAKTTCTNCNTVYMIPSTIEEQTVETCRMCHPIYTGKKQTDRRGGRIDRFRKRAEAAKK